MSTLATPATTTWNVDSTHSVVEFKVKHMMISNVKGQFTGVTGTLSLDEADLTQSSVEAAIEIASIHTRDEGRDAHLKSADFFDAEQFPTMQLKSTHIALKSDGELVVAGDLTIKGVTRSVAFAVEGPTPAAKDPWGSTRIPWSSRTFIAILPTIATTYQPNQTPRLQRCDWRTLQPPRKADVC
jgi:polyisoprenoid-binding protein YceI